MTEDDKRVILEAYAKAWADGGTGMDAWNALLAAGHNPKQLEYRIERLCDYRLMECGVSTRTAWVEPKGYEWLRSHR